LERTSEIGHESGEKMRGERKREREREREREKENGYSGRNETEGLISLNNDDVTLL